MYVFVSRYELVAALILLHGVYCVINFSDEKRAWTNLFHIYFNALGGKEK